ncbi:MAG: hypothetical protein HYY93_09745 [Planctomycetes bacterium]|nr:hypothetical protein [Planctomycetota bacterium]
MRVHRPLILLFALSALALPPLPAVRADRVVMKNGSVIHGTVTGEEGDRYVVKVESGKMKIRKEDVLHVDYSDPAKRVPPPPPPTPDEDPPEPMTVPSSAPLPTAVVPQEPEAASTGKSAEPPALDSTVPEEAAPPTQPLPSPTPKDDLEEWFPAWLRRGRTGYLVGGAVFGVALLWVAVRIWKAVVVPRRLSQARLEQALTEAQAGAAEPPLRPAALPAVPPADTPSAAFLELEPAAKSRRCRRCGAATPQASGVCSGCAG